MGIPIAQRKLGPAAAENQHVLVFCRCGYDGGGGGVVFCFVHNPSVQCRVRLPQPYNQTFIKSLVLAPIK